MRMPESSTFLSYFFFFFFLRFSVQSVHPRRRRRRRRREREREREREVCVFRHSFPVSDKLRISCSGINANKMADLAELLLTKTAKEYELILNLKDPADKLR